MPFLIIIIPAFWAMYLIATLLEIPLAAILDVLPLDVSLALNTYATPALLVGTACALFGNYSQLSELLLNRNTARDVTCMTLGATLVLTTFLTLPNWPLVTGRCAFAALTMFYPASLFGRAIMDRTETAFSTISLAFLCLIGLGALTWLVIF